MAMVVESGRPWASVCKTGTNRWEKGHACHRMMCRTQRFCRCRTDIQQTSLWLSTTSSLVHYTSGPPHLDSQPIPTTSYLLNLIVVIGPGCHAFIVHSHRVLLPFT
jgi:hypothetical protein